MISVLSNIAGIPTVAEENPYVEKSDQKLGRDQFLRLFLAQLSHQDPLNPMASTEFSAQLAQFSSLEQLFNVNENLEAIKDVQDGSSRLQALDLIGKEIEAEGNVLSLEPGRDSMGSFSLDNIAQCAVLITDPDGYPVREIKMGILEPGRHSFEWDGNNENGDMMDQGVYGFDVTAVTESGQTVPVETRIRGQINRVSLEGETPLLYIGEMPLYISQIVDIRLPEPETEEL
ncbi:MAG: flagellar hook assembly protein FlgD [Deltaproteobacteria bacterium]|nr:flagellar hook assembly protein FlgD [Deltaproteobacteria bacterium]